jgi:hypothetical protein
MDTLTQDQAQKLLDYWQEKLRLRDWEIDVEVVKPMEIDDDFGRTHIYSDKRVAKIFVTSPDDRVHGDLASHGLDPEKTLVHEMLHIWFDHAGADGIESGPQRDKDLAHQAINAIALACVSVRRENAEAYADD